MYLTDWMPARVARIVGYEGWCLVADASPTVHIITSRHDLALEAAFNEGRMVYIRQLVDGMLAISIDPPTEGV